MNHTIETDNPINMDSLKEFLAPKTFNQFSFVVNICWVFLGVTLSAIFLDAESSESRFDFRCGSNGDKELIRGKCYEQYEKQYHKFGIPVYGFVILNFFLTSSVSGAPNDNFRKNIRSEDDLRSKIFGTFFVKFLACLPLLAFSNI